MLSRTIFIAVICSISLPSTAIPASGKAPICIDQELLDFAVVSTNSEPGLSSYMSDGGTDIPNPRCASISHGYARVPLFPEASESPGGETIEAWFTHSERAGSAHDDFSETRNVADLALSYLVKAAVKASVPNKVQDLEAQGILNEPLTGNPKKHDPDLMISVKSVLNKQRAKEELTLIDLRNNNAFERFRIPGSINIPLYAVKTKEFLNSRALVLVNEGFKCRRLEESCRQLRDAGFLVWILEGGLNCWKEAGAPLDGNSPAQNDLNKISPADLFEERDHGGWIAVDARKANKSEETLHSQQEILTVVPDSTGEFISPLIKLIHEQKKRAPLSIVIFNEDGTQYERLEKAIRKAGIRNVFYLKGGIEGYRAFLEQQGALLQRENLSNGTLEKCSSCP